MSQFKFKNVEQRSKDLAEVAVRRLANPRGQKGDLMDFRIADTFTDSLARLTGDEQKAVKTTAFDLQLNPANPGMSFHKLDKAKDKNFWSVRVSSDIRLIVHKTRGEPAALLRRTTTTRPTTGPSGASWRRIPKTGAAQLVEIRETVKEVVVPVYVQTELPRAKRRRAEAPVRRTSRRRTARLRRARRVAGRCASRRPRTRCWPWPTTCPPRLRRRCWNWRRAASRACRSRPSPATNPFDHPDAQRRFRVMTNVEELQRALDFPWEKWTVFLHPEQRQWVERDYTGPARVSGSAGTGKTIVALHRAAHLARTHPDARVLLTTFSDTLANALQTKLKRLLGSEPRLAERIDVHSLERHRSAALQGARRAGDDCQPRDRARTAAGGREGRGRPQVQPAFSAHRMGAGGGCLAVGELGGVSRCRAPRPKDAAAGGAARGAVVHLRARSCRVEGAQADHARRAVHRAGGRDLRRARTSPFDFAVVDEAQDISVAHLRFLAALGGDRPNALFFAGDLGQRIFQQPFSWKALGVDIRGRSRTLRVNYRTSHQIRTQADRLLGPVVTDVDGNSEDRSDTVSVFNGPPPTIRVARERERGDQGRRRLDCGAGEGRACCRTSSACSSAPQAQLDRARAAVKEAGMAFKVLDEHVETTSGHVSISTMHLAKGLEFRAVVVMACDDEIIPLQERIETVGDDADLQEVYDTERHLLYVACTRARDHLLVTSVEPASEFLDDMRG